MSPQRRITLKTYTGFPASSQLFTLFMMAGIVASLCVCILAQQMPMAVLILALSFALAIAFAIIADRRRKRQQDRYIAEVVREANRPKQV
jgi:1,4-dihydroxy-2-naphthoate octaprenyltransferase